MKSQEILKMLDKKKKTQDYKEYKEQMKKKDAEEKDRLEKSIKESELSYAKYVQNQIDVTNYIIKKYRVIERANEEFLKVFSNSVEIKCELDHRDYDCIGRVRIDDKYYKSIGYILSSNEMGNIFTVKLLKLKKWWQI